MNAQTAIEGLKKQAVYLMARQKGADALACLKQARQIEPQNAQLLYLTGAVYMQSGLMDKALEWMQQAVQVDPNLHAAHFHIGFLLFNEDRDTEAEQAWKKLEPLGEDHAFVLFTKGIQAWSRDDFAACRKYLQRGLELNTPHGLFNAEMHQILAWADEEEGDETDEEESAEKAGGANKELPPQVKKHLKSAVSKPLKLPAKTKRQSPTLPVRGMQGK